jgi:hypothetical protein
MQLASAGQSAGSIRANLNYIVDTGVPPVHYVDWPEMEHKATPPRYELREVEIRNGRPLRSKFELDTHGFVFVDHDTKVRDFADRNQRKDVYDREVTNLIKRCSGASDVVVFDHTVRIGDQQTRTAANARPPVKGVHNDYTESSAPRRLRDILGDAAAEKRLNKRFAIIQVWRPINRKVVIDPLAICDARSIPREGFVYVVQALQQLVSSSEVGVAAIRDIRYGYSRRVGCSWREGTGAMIFFFEYLAQAFSDVKKGGIVGWSCCPGRHRLAARRKWLELCEGGFLPIHRAQDNGNHPYFTGPMAL